MRDLKHVDDKGQGMSKGYGFVSFEKHDDALTALRKINNNPTIFTPVAVCSSIKILFLTVHLYNLCYPITRKLLE